MTVSIALFTRDLRLHDNPVLRAALDAAEETVPLFVRDDRVRAAGYDVPNRRAFLADCLTDLDAGLRERGGRLVLRSGDVVAETCRIRGAHRGPRRGTGTLPSRPRRTVSDLRVRRPWLHPPAPLLR